MLESLCLMTVKSALCMHTVACMLAGRWYPASEAGADAATVAKRVETDFVFNCVVRARALLSSLCTQLKQSVLDCRIPSSARAVQ